MSAVVTVYRTRMCPYCVMAVRLLVRKGVAPREVALDGDPSARVALRARTAWHTVPQIFVGEKFVGGYSELKALDRSGELDHMLAELG